MKFASMQRVVGALVAWRMARESGQGQIVDASRFEAMLLCLTVYHDLDGQWNEGPVPRSIEIPSIERAKDGWVGICTITGQQWKDFCVMIERPDLAEDERYHYFFPGPWTDRLRAEGAAGGVFNVASGRRTSLNQLVGAISRGIGKQLDVQYGDERAGDVKHSWADIEATRAALGPIR